MFSLYFLLLLIGRAVGSHYRGGTMSYIIRPNSGNISINNEKISVQITQRHSWRRSAFFCNDTDPNSGDILGGDILTHNPNSSRYPLEIPSIDTSVRCTDYNEEFDYSSGESSTTVLLPINQRIEYFYAGCCWITLLPPDSESDWSLKFIINTNRRSDGTWNNSPKTTMNPIVQVQVGQIHVIRIPMVDSDGDAIRCRWGNSMNECGSICAVKGPLRSNPCELIYNASQIGYHAVALVIEDFDSNNNVLSAIPLQFLIHIVNITTKNNCTKLPVFIGEWSQDSCIGIESNTTLRTHIQVYIPCENTDITLTDILTVSPPGLIRENIIRDLFNQSIYTMPIEWTPQSDQYDVYQLCLTPVDSEHRTGSQMCLTFQVDVHPPEFIRMVPTGLVSASQSLWIIETDRDIIKPKRSNGVYIHFFKRSNNEEVYRINVVNNSNVSYQSRQIRFFTRGYTWEQGAEYYILLDNGIAILNESCGVESFLLNNSNAWVFRVAVIETTRSKEIITTEQFVPTTTKRFIPVTTEKFIPTTTKQFARITTEQFVPTTTKQFASTTTKRFPPITTEKISSSSTRQITTTSRSNCPRWFRFDTISNESTNANEPYFTFCFTVETKLADVTIAANTWVPCMTWKLSGTADPLLELYSEPEDVLLAQNDDGNSLTFQNCYAAILSYRLTRGDYRVIIRNPKCAYGKFELRLSAEIDRNLK